MKTTAVAVVAIAVALGAPALAKTHKTQKHSPWFRPGPGSCRSVYRRRAAIYSRRAQWLLGHNDVGLLGRRWSRPNPRLRRLRGGPIDGLPLKGASSASARSPLSGRKTAESLIERVCAAA